MIENSYIYKYFVIQNIIIFKKDIFIFNRNLIKVVLIFN